MTKLAEYKLTLTGPPVNDTNWQGPITRTAVGLSESLQKELVENVNKLLPEGYSVQLRPMDVRPAPPAEDPELVSWQGRGARCQ